MLRDNSILDVKELVGRVNHCEAFLDRVLTTYFWWVVVSAPYYVAKFGIASQRAGFPFLDTKGGRVFSYSAAVLALVVLTSWAGGGPQNRAGLFAIMLAPAMLGIYFGFKMDKVLPVVEENYVTAAQRKVNAFGAAIANSPTPTCIPLSQLPYSVPEIKEALQRLYLFAENDGVARISLQMGYLQLADFVPDGQAEIVRLWYQRVADGPVGDGLTLGEEALHILREMQVQHNALGEEWDSWLRLLEPGEATAE